MIYGDGGASKTTLGIDLAVHLAAGDEWLGISVAEPRRVLIIEAEGPRPLFRSKLRRKLAGWRGSELADRLHVLETPWAEFRFPDAEDVATQIAEHQIDVLIVGPLTRVGMDELGTLQEVRDFVAQVDAFRSKTGRRLTVVLIHHENKGGSVSGAWEGAGDTLLHAQVHEPGKTVLFVQKARHSTDWHKRTLKLGWTDGEGFEVIEERERDLLEEIVTLLTESPDRSPSKRLRTKKEIAAKSEGGIGRNETDVGEVLAANPDLFRSYTKEAAKAMGRPPTATLWGLAEGCASDRAHLGAPALARGARDVGAPVRPPLQGAPATDAAPLPAPQAAPTPSAAQRSFDDEELDDGGMTT
jgi:AAA domain